VHRDREGNMNASSPGEKRDNIMKPIVSYGLIIMKRIDLAERPHVSAIRKRKRLYRYSKILAQENLSDFGLDAHSSA
jgi:hypothetical protein